MNVAELDLATANRSMAYAQYAEALRYPKVEQDNGANGVDYNEAFEKSVSKKACSLYEVDYATAQLDSLLEELIRFYDYFGLKRNEDSERPDHLCVELEFMHFLTYMEHQIIERRESTEDLRRAQHDFLSRHIHRLVTGAVKNYSADSCYYHDLLDELHDFVQEDLESLKCAE